ncbi:hypothetical protein POL68_06780 [Stigmatella sp. ncwal1]|uniref:Uncharacterized protein n=1 Tax=Stigmatella ashevillensis TaxID=2995309 RepID=A0ABT5D3C4_9BACT|nr:hypothetical protein [Stigmatella ashevillena]MDC0708169.1 hypothetical protein [Stigmatella ashevillena]
MSWHNVRFPQGFFRITALPEEGAQVADVAEALVPGGRGFVQQLFRAKKDLLKGISHLIEAEINELDKIDTALADESRPRADGRMMTIKQMMERVGASYGSKYSRRPDLTSCSKPGVQGPASQSTAAASTPGDGSSTSSRPSAEGPEKIKIT